MPEIYQTDLTDLDTRHAESLTEGKLKARQQRTNKGPAIGVPSRQALLARRLMAVPATAVMAINEMAD